jgi:hypothetical protein
VEHAAREEAHLGVATLAGVLAKCLRQGGYLLEGSQDNAVDAAAAGIALGQIGLSSAKLAAPARRANDGAGP